MELPGRRQGKYLAAGRSDADRMFELGRQGFIAGHGSPVIGQHLGFRAAQVDHRFDGKEHPFLKHRTGSGPAIMQDIGRRMKHAPQTVTAEIAHHRHPVGLDKALDCKADVAERVARLNRSYATHQRFVRHLDQSLGLARCGACHIHPAGITKPAIDAAGQFAD